MASSKNPDHRVARSTIAKTLKGHGVKPSPERGMSWRTFLRVHANAVFGANAVGLAVTRAGVGRIGY